MAFLRSIPLPMQAPLSTCCAIPLMVENHFTAALPCNTLPWDAKIETGQWNIWASCAGDCRCCWRDCGVLNGRRLGGHKGHRLPCLRNALETRPLSIDLGVKMGEASDHEAVLLVGVRIIWLILLLLLDVAVRIASLDPARGVALPGVIARPKRRVVSCSRA